MKKCRQHRFTAMLQNSLAASAVIYLSIACVPPAEEYTDASTADATLDDAGSSDLAENDAGASDAAASDQAASDAAASDSSIGQDSADNDANLQDSGTADAGSCEPLSFNDCDNVAASGASYTIESSALRLSGTHSVEIGQNLSTVRSAMTGLTETSASFNNFAIVYCSEGLVFYYADNLSAAASSKGALGDDDALYKMTAFGPFAGQSDDSPQLSIGSSTTKLNNAWGTADFVGEGQSLSGGPGSFHFFYTGQSALVNADQISSISIFKAQSPSGTLDAVVDFAAGSVGSISVTNTTVATVPVPDGSTISETRTAFGAEPEADGDSSVSVGSNSVDVFVLSYSNLGVRFSGLANPFMGPSGEDRKLFTAILSPPFQGKDGDVGIGSSKAEVEGLFGAPYDSEAGDDGTVLYKYNVGQRKAGVIYTQDSDCTYRAIVFIVNLID